MLKGSRLTATGRVMLPLGLDRSDGSAVDLHEVGASGSDGAADEDDGDFYNRCNRSVTSRYAARRGVGKCHEVMEQVARKAAGEGKDPSGDVDGWADRSPQDRAEAVFVQAVDTRSPMPPDSHVIKRLARSAER